MCVSEKERDSAEREKERKKERDSARVDGMGVRVGVDARARACGRVDLLIQYATRMHNIVSDLSGSTTLFDIVS